MNRHDALAAGVEIKACEQIPENFRKQEPRHSRDLIREMKNELFERIHHSEVCMLRITK